MKQLAYLSVVALTVVALVETSCSSDRSTTSAPSTAGSTSSAGASSMAGSSAAGSASSVGGVGTAIGGASSVGGAGGALGCQISTAPIAALFADFEQGATAAGMPIVPNGGMFSYSTGTVQPTIAVVNGALHATIDAPLTTAIQYAGYGIFFNDCIDGSQYTGVKFDIGGTMAGCSLQFIVNFREDASVVNDPVKGSCTLPNCYGPQADIIVPAAVTSTSYSFVTLSNGFPFPTVNTAFLTGVQWGLVIPAADATTDAAAANCVADMTIDNVSFY